MIELKSEDKYLKIKHINAEFNCCPEELLINSKISNDTIFVYQDEKKTMCNCVCRYDLNYKVGTLEYKTYHFVLNHMNSVLMEFDLDFDKKLNKNITISYKNDNQSIVGTWKCIGFGNTETNEIKPIEPEDCTMCYTITFKQDGTFEGKSVQNVFLGSYELNNTSLEIIKVGGTKVGETRDAGIFIDAIWDIKKWIFNKESISIFYSKREYLLFNRKSK